MKKILLLILLISPFSFTQTKYMIYFKDKGAEPGKALNKNSAVYNNALNMLSNRSILRREKAMGKNNIITYDDLPLSVNYVNSIKAAGIKIENQLKWFNAVSAYLTEEQLNIVKSLSFVESVEQVKVVKFNREKTISTGSIKKISSGVSAADYGGAYGQLNLSDVPEVHAKGITGSGVIIGILDNGFHWKQHESLVSRKVIAEYNFVFKDSSTAPQPGDAYDSGNHGSTVFSIIGGYKDGSMIGPAYNASFILAKTEDDRSESRVEEDNYAAALEWMEGLGVDITTSSLGYNTFDTVSTSYSYKNMNGITTISAKAANLAYDRGVLTFSAAGNEGTDSWYYITTPADALNIIAVGAVDNSKNVADFSSRGPTSDGRIKPDVVAQGVLVYGADVSSSGGYSSYQRGDGTSFAAPIASGIGALLLSAYPYLTNDQARSIILQTASNSDNPDNTRGYGLISAEKAIAYPNISDTSGNYRINKIFFSSNGIQNAAIHYSLDSVSFSEQQLSYDGSLIYSFALPVYPSGQQIYFYYTYSDNAGTTYREPASRSFAVKYGLRNVVTSVASNTVQPNIYFLDQNYPNPFNPSTTIKYSVGGNNIVQVKLLIYNILGQKVKTLVDNAERPGAYSVQWNGRSDSDNLASSGVYFYVLKVGSYSQIKKMILVK